VSYAESALPADRRSVAQPGSAFADLDYALYLGAGPRSEALAIASTDDLPLGGRTASTTVELGDTALHLVIAPTTSLAGGLMALLPWMIAATGLLVSVGAALFTERLLRSRDHAELLAAELGRVADENARLYAEQRTVAQTLQENLLPHALPDVEGIDIGVRYESGVHSLDVGGDWYDVIDTGGGRAVFVVGDVSGRGLPAATIMASLRHAIRAYAVQGDEPAEILARLALLLSVVRDGHFATVLCGVVDPVRREITLASAGHPQPLLIDGVGARFVETHVGVPVGTVAEPSYRSVTVAVPSRATLLLFTDGLFERRGETLDVGLERLRRVASDGDVPLDALLTQVLDGLAAGRGSDDTAILALRWRT
jgi:serine phosphatase RsbU (regulator of sigma subunit)